MLNFLFGRAIWRFLEQLTEEPKPAAKPQPETPPPPKPQIVIQPAPVLTDLDLPAATGEMVYPTVRREAMGSLFEIYLAGHGRETLVGAGEEALDEIERLDRQLSHYRPDSDLSRMNAHAATQWVRLEPRMYSLMKRCAELCEHTDGAFDITTAPLVNAWGFHDGNHRVPSQDEIEQIMCNVGMARIAFDDSDDVLLYTAPGLSVNLGAIGKGYAIDEAADRLRFYAVSRAVIHGGQSTIYALGAPEGEDGWEFVIRDPRDHETPIETVRLCDEALSTSGNYEQYFDHDGVRYSHIIDPRTGYPTQDMLSVSVIAPSAADSDALSTAFFVMGPEATEAYCAQHPELRVLMMRESPDGGLAITRIGFPAPPQPTVPDDGNGVV